MATGPTLKISVKESPRAVGICRKESEFPEVLATFSLRRGFSGWIDAPSLPGRQEMPDLGAGRQFLPRS
jgi:hypothetical protein